MTGHNFLGIDLFVWVAFILPFALLLLVMLSLILAAIPCPKDICEGAKRCPRSGE